MSQGPFHAMLWHGAFYVRYFTVSRGGKAVGPPTMDMEAVNREIVRRNRVLGVSSNGCLASDAMPVQYVQEETPVRTVSPAIEKALVKLAERKARMKASLKSMADDETV